MTPVDFNAFKDFRGGNEEEEEEVKKDNFGCVVCVVVVVVVLAVGVVVVNNFGIFSVRLDTEVETTLLLVFGVLKEEEEEKDGVVDILISVVKFELPAKDLWTERAATCALASILAWILKIPPPLSLLAISLRA